MDNQTRSIPKPTDQFDSDIERCQRLMEGNPNAIFVFGSNEAGRHGAGAAASAMAHYGAVYGRGFGRQGRSFAIPTLDGYLRQRSISSIKIDVDDFLYAARNQPELLFVVSRIGCGLAGFKDEEIAPLFKGAPKNCELPEGWR